MKQKKWSVEKITSILQEFDAGVPATELCQKYGMSDATFYNWKKKYGGMTVFEAQRLKELEQENLKLKRQQQQNRISTGQWILSMMPFGTAGPCAVLQLSIAAAASVRPSRSAFRWVESR